MMLRKVFLLHDQTTGLMGLNLYELLQCDNCVLTFLGGHGYPYSLVITMESLSETLCQKNLSTMFKSLQIFNAHFCGRTQKASGKQHYGATEVSRKAGFSFPPSGLTGPDICRCYMKVSYFRVTAILDQIILCCEGHPVHCRMLSNVSGLSTLAASSPSHENQKFLQNCQCPLGEKKSQLSGSELRTTVLDNDQKSLLKRRAVFQCLCHINYELFYFVLDYNNVFPTSAISTEYAFSFNQNKGS